MTEHTVPDLSGVQSPLQAARLLTSEDYELVEMVTEQVGTVGAAP